MRSKKIIQKNKKNARLQKVFAHLGAGIDQMEKNHQASSISAYIMCLGACSLCWRAALASIPSSMGIYLDARYKCTFGVRQTPSTISPSVL